MRAVRSHSRPAAKTLDDPREGEPLLCPQAMPIVATETVGRGQLVSNPCRLDRLRPRSRLEHHIPPWKQHAKIAAIARALVTIANRVVTPVKRGTYQQASEQRNKRQARVHVLDALQDIPHGDKHHELRWRHPD